MSHLLKHIPVDVRARADAALALATADLGLKGVRIEWVGRWGMRAAGASLTAAGTAKSDAPDRVFVRHDAEGVDVADVVAHECRHLWQYAHAKFNPNAGDYAKAKREGEDDAVAYGRRIAAKVDALPAEAAFLHALRSLGRPAETPAGKSGCGCGSKSAETPEDFYRRTLKRIGEAPVMPPRGWLLEQVLGKRAGYRDTVCALPRYADSLPLCQEKPSR